MPPAQPRSTGKRSADGLSRQRRRQRQIAEAVIGEGSIRIEELAERFDVSVMTVHRDLDELETRGVLRKTRGQATALATSLFESNAMFRVGQQQAEKEALAQTAMNLVEPGHSILMDDSTTGVYLARVLPQRAPLTVISNFRGVIDELTDAPGITVIGLGGQYFSWCDAFMGDMTVSAIRDLRADTCVMSTSAITDGVCFHQRQDTVTFKRAMFESAAQRILYVDHTKFTRRALHALLPVSAFDAVIVDWRTPQEDVDRLREEGAAVTVAEAAESAEPGEGDLAASDA